jgi:hypothetical protein
MYIITCDSEWMIAVRCAPEVLAGAAIHCRDVAVVDLFPQRVQEVAAQHPDLGSSHRVNPRGYQGVKC